LRFLLLTRLDNCQQAIRPAPVGGPVRDASHDVCQRCRQRRIYGRFNAGLPARINHRAVQDCHLGVGFALCQVDVQ